MSLFRLRRIRPHQSKTGCYIQSEESAPANKVCRLRPRDSSRAVLWWRPDLYGFRCSLTGRVVHWRTRYILPPLPHCLWWLPGYRRTRVPARLRPPAARVLPPALPAAAAPCRFLLRPPAGLPRPAPAARTARPRACFSREPPPRRMAP